MAKFLIDVPISGWTLDNAVDYIFKTCQFITGNYPAKRHEVQLVFGTALTESGFKTRVQRGGGPARGLWQMEPFTAQDLFKRYLVNMGYLLRWTRLMSCWLDLGTVQYFIPTIEELSYHLEHNDRFACAMCRIDYLSKPGAIPDTIEGQAAYYKQWYNTPLGKGSVKKYLADWKAFGADKLIDEYFMS